MTYFNDILYYNVMEYDIMSSDNNVRRWFVTSAVMYHIQHALSARMWLHISSSLGPQRTFICPSSPADLAIRQKFHQGWKQGSGDVLGKRSTLTFWKNYDHDANLYKSNKHSLFDFVCFCRYRWRLRFDSRKHASHTLFTLLLWLSIYIRWIISAALKKNDFQA